MTAPVTAAPGAEELTPAMVALALILRAKREQAEKHGHNAENDDEAPIDKLPCLARRSILEAIDVLLPGDHENLEVGVKRLARAGALILSAIERVRREQERRARS